VTKKLKYGLLLAALWSVTFAHSQSYNERFDPYLNQVGQELGMFLEKFESLGVKTSGSTALEETYQWLFQTYDSLGYNNIVPDSFFYAGHWNKNLIVSKSGTNPDAPYLYVISHYDTRNGPGANDNGSGVAATLEIARIIQPLTSSLNLRFIHFAAEENGLIGSEHYVNNTLSQTDSILCVFNLDQLGGTKGQGADNYKIFCERDENAIPSSNNAYSNALTEKLKLLMETYTEVEGVIGPAYRSDYIPFEEKGYVITGLYQYSSSPFNHSVRDSISQMDTIATMEICKGALSFVLEILQSEETVSLRPIAKSNVEVFPNPAKDYINLEAQERTIAYFEIIHPSGRTCYEGNVKQNRIDVRPLSNGVYILRLTFKEGSVATKKIVVQR
jgi:aminopeptidase YwaD